MGRGCWISVVTSAYPTATEVTIKCKELHKVSWRHPRSHHWNQLDLNITRRADLSSVLPTRSCHSADCDMDHSFVTSNVRLKPRKIHHAKTEGRPRITPAALTTPPRHRALPTASRRNLMRNNLFQLKGSFSYTTA